VRRMGARLVSRYAVLGPYDFVTIMEMAAIPLDEFIGRLEGGAPRRQGKKNRA
jgi:uncharacterized protein with GYD domain